MNSKPQSTYSDKNVYLLGSTSGLTTQATDMLQTAKIDVHAMPHPDHKMLRTLNERHTVILNIDLDNLDNMSILRSFLKRTKRPKLIITARENEIFQTGDMLAGGLAEILFAPLNRVKLLAAIKSP